MPDKITDINPLMAVDPSAYLDYLENNRRFHIREYATVDQGNRNRWMAVIYNLCLIWDELKHDSPKLCWDNLPCCACDEYDDDDYEYALNDSGIPVLRVEPGSHNRHIVVINPGNDDENTLTVSLGNELPGYRVLRRLLMHLDEAAGDIEKVSDIDWRIWHSRVMESIHAFEIDTVVAVTSRMEVGFKEDDEWNRMYASYLYTELYDTMCHLIRLHRYKCPTDDEARWRGYNTYVDDGLLTTDIRLFYKEQCTDMYDVVTHGTPYISVTLRDRDLGGDEPFFQVRFIMGGQMF